MSPTPEPTGAVALIREAIAQKVDPAALRELLAVKEQWEASEARKAYNRAVSDFQRGCPIIAKEDKSFTASYARMDRIWRTIRPLLTGLGLSVTWHICALREGVCHVEGKLRHRDGHAEDLIMDLPLPERMKNKDGKDVQNAPQQMGSASTYAKRYAMCAALGIVTGDDDDGEAAGAIFVTEEQARAVTDKIEACRGLPDFTPELEKTFWEWSKASCPEELRANRFNDVMAALDRKLKPKTGGVK